MGDFGTVSTSTTTISSAIDDDDTTPPPTFDHVFDTEVSSYCKFAEELITDSIIDPVDGSEKKKRIYKQRCL